MALFSAKEKPFWREVLIALSLANLCFINIWYLTEELPTPAFNYYRQHSPDATILFATFFDVLLTGVLLWSSWRLVKRHGNSTALKFAQAAFLVVLSYPVEKLIDYLGMNGDQISYAGCIGLIVAETGLLFGVMMLLFFGNRTILRIATRATMFLALLFPSLAFDLGWAWISRPPAKAFSDPPLAGAVQRPKKTTARVVWLLFDEMDQGLLFEHRPPGINLPNLDRFRSESLYADDARPTARWTMIALPALITGHLLSRAELKGASDLALWPEDDSKALSWRADSNVFRRVRNLGMDTAMIGWHHPYCRVLNDVLSYCHWESSEQGSAELETEYHLRRLGIMRGMIFIMEWKIEDALTKLHVIDPGFSRVAIQKSLRLRQQEEFRDIRSRALDVVANPNLDFVMVHWPAPHPYGIFDRFRNAFSTRADSTYLDNLVLVDRTMGEIRAAMEKAGVWDSTAILVTADHPLRPEMWRGKLSWTAEMEQAVKGHSSVTVPFLLKMAGEKQSAPYHDCFNAVLTHDLLIAIAKSDVKTSDEAIRWLQANRTRYPEN